jgi:hypothetical protein
MRKTLFIFFFLFIPSLTFAQGSAVQTGRYLGVNQGVFELTFDCTASAVDGSFPAIAFDAKWLNALRGWHCYRARTDPGTTAPTANYDITITESGGDVFGGNLVNRSATATEFSAPYIDGPTAKAVGAVTMADTWSLVITNNAVNSAAIEITLYFFR